MYLAALAPLPIKTYDKHLNDLNSPTAWEIEPQSKGEVISIQKVGGLYHLYIQAG